MSKENNKKKTIINHFFGWISFILVLLVVVIGLLYYFYFKMLITEPLTMSEARVSKELEKREQESNVINIAMLGITNTDSLSQSEVIRIFSLDKNDRTIKVTAISSDLLVYLPGSNNELKQLNNVYSEGTSLATIQALNTNFNLDITRYITVNLDIIEQLVEKIGGIEVNITENQLKGMNQYLKGMYETDEFCLTTEGKQVLSGKQVMSYLRDSTISDSDKIERENQIFTIIAKEVASKKVFLFEIMNWLSTCLPYVESNLTIRDFLQILFFNALYFEESQIIPTDDVFNSDLTTTQKAFSFINSYQEIVQSLHTFIYNGQYNDQLVIPIINDFEELKNLFKNNYSGSAGYFFKRLC